MTEDALAPSLLARAAALVEVPSVSRDEGAIADEVESRLRLLGHLEVVRIANNVVARTSLGRGTRVVVAGHLDTVLAAGNAAPRLEGRRLYGLGSADMKGGLAVMLEVAAAVAEPAHDVTFAFYASEEIAREHSGLLEIEAARPDLLLGDVAVLMEPTAATVEAGCQGVLRLAVEIRGRRAHSARPWVGLNAIHRLGPVLGRVCEFEERRPVLDGCEYHETLQAVAVEGGVAGNVVPDRARLILSHRFAPDRDESAARSSIERLLAPALDSALGDVLEVLDHAPSAAPQLGHPLLAALVRESGAPARAKIAWTDVAFFSERQIPAANYGPGDPQLAHTPEEFVEADELVRCYLALCRLLEAPHAAVGRA